MGFDLKRFGSFMSKGLSLFTPDFTADYSLAISSTNMLQGMRQGMGPRFGMSPIPGHNHTATKTWSGGDYGYVPAGLMQSESTTYALQHRVKFFGVLPIRLADNILPLTTKTYFAWITGWGSSDPYTVEIGIGSEQLSHYGASIAIFGRSSDIIAGLPRPSVSGCADNYILQNHPALAMFSIKAYATRGTDLANLLSYGTKFYLPTTSITVSGKDVPQKNFVGVTTTAGSATVAPGTNLVSQANNMYPMGVPSWVNARRYSTALHNLTAQSMVEGIYAPYGLVVKYVYNNIKMDATTIIPANQQDSGMTQTILGTATSVSGRADAAVFDPSVTNFVLFQDPDNTTNSAYSAIFAANGKAVACLFQPWNQNFDGTLNQWVDLTSPVFSVPNNFTYIEGDASLSLGYVINQTPKQTGWAKWLTFARGATDVGYTSGQILYKTTESGGYGYLNNQINYGENNSGILRGGIVYEIAYSLYNKRLNYETNVGLPAKIQIPLKDQSNVAVDYVSLTLFRARTGTHSFQIHAANVTGGTQTYETVFPRNFNTQSATPQQIPLNDTEYRVYYRQEGTFEWLPAGAIDAAEYWYNPTLVSFVVCASDFSGLPGGRAGGFNDYSNLPQDTYTNVLQWRNRVWWMSSKSLLFSMINNIFAYPLRNSVTCPSGEFRGAIVHAFPGQAQQEGRLLIFGSDETYIGRFTGSPTQYPVQISYNNVASFPLDGSDFTVERWTTCTSFSSRSAVVAEGDLFFWGPRGVWRDNGTEFPDRMTQDIEPAVFTLYDPNKTDEIFAHYFSESREIFWFFPPKDTTIKTTRALVFNYVTGQFSFCDFNCKIDSISECNIEGTDTTRAIGGIRRVASVRADSDATLQRGYFFDIRNKTGDYEPTKDMLVKKVETNIANGYVRLWLAEGYDAASAAAVVPGDKILVSQYLDYSGQTDFPDFVGIVSAANVAGWYDVKLPASVTVATPASTTLAVNNYTPIWTSRHNAITWALNGNYWSPTGLNAWAYFLFLHHQYKVNLIADDVGPQLIIAARTPISKGLLSRTATLVDNSDGNCQLYSQLLPSDQGFEGQAIKLNFSGTYLGHDWTMQYLGIDPFFIPEGDFLRMFEG